MSFEQIFPSSTFKPLIWFLKQLQESLVPLAFNKWFDTSLPANRKSKHREAFRHDQAT